MSKHQNNSITRLLWTTSAAILLLAGTGLSAPAFSQSMPVTVDLSVLNDNGYGPATITGGTMALIMPGTDTPKSSYFGPSVSVSNPILSAPSTSMISQTVSEADSEIETQSTTTSALSASDTVPPPPPEPVAVTVPAEEKTVNAELTPTATVPGTPEPAPLPEAPAEPEVSSTSSSTTAIALEPTVPNAPPEAPKVVEVKTASPDTTVTTEASASSTETIATEVATASILASGMSASGHVLQIIFGDADSKLPGSVEARLSAIAEQIKDSDSSRIQLLAYAGGESLSASKARRLSLSRALSVRSFFIENGVRSTRIDVRALGNKTDEQPINRVDINIIER